MKEKLSILEQNLRRINAPVLKYFRPPMEDENILSSFVYKHFGKDVAIPHELMEFYKWHSGTNYRLADNEIREGYLAEELCFNDLIEVEEILSGDSFYNFRDNKLFPLFTSFNGEELAVQLDVEQRLIYCSTSNIEVDSTISMYDNISTFLDSLNSFYENNCLVISKFNTIILDANRYKLYMEIGEKLNPKSDYWRVVRAFQEGE